MSERSKREIGRGNAYCSRWEPGQYRMVLAQRRVVGRNSALVVTGAGRGRTGRFESPVAHQRLHRCCAQVPSRLRQRRTHARHRAHRQRSDAAHGTSRALMEFARSAARFASPQPVRRQWLNTAASTPCEYSEYPLSTQSTPLQPVRRQWLNTALSDSPQPARKRARSAAVRL